MAGNFWQSSHSSQWILEKVDLLRERAHDLQVLSDEEYQKIIIFFASFIQTLGEQLKLRQQVIATATVYFKRFYSQNSLKCVDPLLLAPTSVFLASKVEEFGVISNTRLINTCTAVVKNKFAYAYPNQVSTHLETRSVVHSTQCRKTKNSLPHKYFSVKSIHSRVRSLVKR